MSEFLVAHEAEVRAGLFLGLFVLFALLEWRWPRRAVDTQRRKRWPTNLGIVAVNSALLRIAFPLMAVGVAEIARHRGWGLFNFLDINPVVGFLLALMIMDLVIYLQHVLFHYVPVLWRLHRMHHSDLEFDVSTALRFHPIEIALSMGIKMITVLLLGPPVAAVIVFEVLLNGISMFNHGNINLPRRADAVLRFFVVTPDMHRVHHSVVPIETNSNFGFNLPWWDRLFGTYRAQPESGHAKMTIGLREFRDPRGLGLFRLLLQPFR